jgi:hypothetical protein
MKNQILKLFFSSTFLVILANIAFAQHCPFDGATLIAVKLTDKKGKPIKNAKFTLREINNDKPESCSFTKGLLNKPFMPTQNVLSNLYEMDNVIEKYCADCNFLDDGFYAVKLNQAEETCMIKDGNNYKYKKRKFEISYGKKKYIVEKRTSIIFAQAPENGRGLCRLRL